MTDLDFLRSLLDVVPKGAVPRLEKIIRKVDVYVSCPTANVTLLLSRATNGSYRKVPLVMGDSLSLLTLDCREYHDAGCRNFTQELIGELT